MHVEPVLIIVVHVMVSCRAYTKTSISYPDRQGLLLLSTVGSALDFVNMKNLFLLVAYLAGVNSTYIGKH